MPNYQFKRPETINITEETVKAAINITKETVKALKERLFFSKWQFWVIVGILIVPTILSYGLILLAPLILYVIYVNQKIRKRFWMEFASVNSWQYLEQGNPEQESGVMFRQGDRRSISNVISGFINGRQFRIFSYSFGVGQGKSERIYNYTVFAFKFNGVFPHIYLNNKHNSYGVSVGETVHLPSEFEKRFTLSTPRKYEVEALEIFTPDVMVNLLDDKFSHDVEFVNSEVLIFTSGVMNSSKKLAEEFKKALEIEDLLDDKLDKFKFAAIGDMSHKL